MNDISHFLSAKVLIFAEFSLFLQRYLGLFMKKSDKNLLTTILLALLTLASCTNQNTTTGSNGFINDDGFTRADSIVNDIGDTRDFKRTLEVIDSLEQRGELPLVRTIFYRTISYNLMGQYSTSLRLYAKLAGINPRDLKTQIDFDTYIYSYNNYVRVLCEMGRYDLALREANAVDRKLKAIGFNKFTDHHDIAQIMGECQLYLGQTEQAAKSFEKSLKAIHTRLARYQDPLDYRECQKTMNAIVKIYILTKRYDEAVPWLQMQDSLYNALDTSPLRDSVFLDEMKADISYSKARLALAQGRKDDAEHAFSEYQSTQLAKQLGSIIHSTPYLLLTGRYEEAASNYRELDHFLKESGYKADFENFGRYMIPKFRANLLAGHLDSTLRVATIVAEYYDSALVRQRRIDSDLLTTFYDTEGKERQIAEQRAELSQQRLWTVVIVAVIFAVFVAIYLMQRRRAFKKLNEKNHELMLANERAEESSRMKTKFIQQISHEVRTPLNILSGFTQVLATPDIDIETEELQVISQKIVENSNRITKLVDKMLDLSMVNTNADIECRDTVAPADVARQAVSSSGIRNASHLVFDLQVSPESEERRFVTHQESVVKALVLLLDNAIKFTHPLASKKSKKESGKARVTLNVSATKQQVAFVVEDTGIGIPVEQAENVFTEFLQLDEYSDGTGIGLSIARSLARHMNGDITLDTTYTDGARFVMTLPLKP
jgi:signal transduction histidine kinase